jgi:hypothetical protein
VIEFLLSQADGRISREEYIREISVPAFAHRRLASYLNINFSTNIRLVQLFGCTLSNLPLEVFEQLLRLRNLFFSHHEAFGYVQSVRLAPGDEAIYCDFPEKLLALTDVCVTAGIVHELAHIALDHYSAEIQASTTCAQREDQADSKCIEWGFSFEIETIRGYLKTKNQI